MLNKIVYLQILLLLSGCSPKKVDTKNRMFQSIDKTDAVFVQRDNKFFCTRCGMDLAMFYKTNHIANIEHKRYQYCSIHCLAGHLKQTKKLKNPKVVDIKSLKFINVSDAYYVVGSVKPATMSSVSKYAFSSLELAKGFQNKYGGNIVNFYKALDVAREDFE